MIDTLALRIWTNTSFHEDDEYLQSSHLQAMLLPEKTNDFNQNTLERLLKSAVILSASSNQEHKTAAYRIITSATELLERKFDGIPHLLLLILNRLYNFPAIKYAQKRFDISEYKLPIRIAAEASERINTNQISIGEEHVHLTEFQNKLWKELQTLKDVSISAPTSAGKSFVLQAHARQRFLNPACKNIVFIVPTRALINQVSEDVTKWLHSENGSKELITTPVPEDTPLPKKAVYVLTQERLQLLFNTHKGLKFDLVAIDEFQSIGDGPRGVLLSSVIETTILRNENCQLLFAGPNITDPEKIGQLFGRTPTPIKTSTPTVKQNIIFIDCDPIRNTSVLLSSPFNGEKIKLGELDLGQPLHDHKDKLIHSALGMGGKGQSLIYAMGPAECENIAFGLADADADADQKIVETELKQLSELAKEAVHPQFQLANTVLSGVGYHYGRIPALLRKSIEDTFASGHLKYLVTTSTLLYGVNLPARNLFLHNPQKGANIPISPIDFWNLAGRAGRLGKEFEGNIFLIDYGEWPTAPMEGEKERSVTPTIQQHILEETTDLISYIEDPDIIPERDKQDNFENTFVKLYRDYLNDKIEITFSRIGLTKDDPRYQEIIASLEKVKNMTTLPEEVFSASPTVSIHRQQALYEWIKKSLKKKGPEYVIPKHPLSSKAYMSLLTAMKRCHGSILKIPSKDKSHTYFATLALKWMRGDALPQVIEASYDYKKNKGLKPNYTTVIRTTLTEVEQQLRFKYVRLMSCYNAVLKYVLEESGNEEFIPHIPAIPLYLEVGACSSTMINFMNLGLSRFTASKLRKLAIRTEMDQEEANTWIRAQNLEALDIPQASIKEIKRVFVI